MSTSALSTRGLDKSFGSLVVAKDIELDLPPGERYALIGPNGAGKTTLINLVTGMLRPDRGTILLGGADVTALDPEQRVSHGAPCPDRPRARARRRQSPSACPRPGSARRPSR